MGGGAITISTPPMVGVQIKAGTPTMGGVLIVIATAVPTLLWADLTSAYVLLALVAMLGFAAIGFADDYSKLRRKHNLGLTARSKLFLQILVSFGTGVTLLLMTVYGVYSTQLIVPFLKKLHLDLVIHSLLHHHYLWPLAFLPFLLFITVVIVGSSNAVRSEERRVGK